LKEKTKQIEEWLWSFWRPTCNSRRRDKIIIKSSNSIKSAWITLHAPFRKIGTTNKSWKRPRMVVLVTISHRMRRTKMMGWLTSHKPAYATIFYFFYINQNTKLPLNLSENNKKKNQCKSIKKSPQVLCLEFLNPRNYTLKDKLKKKNSHKTIKWVFL